MNKVTLEKNTAWVEDMNESKNNYCGKTCYHGKI